MCCAVMRVWQRRWITSAKILFALAWLRQKLTIRGSGEVRFQLSSVWGRVFDPPPHAALIVLHERPRFAGQIVVQGLDEGIG
jgi:hypothetical protein